MRRFRKLGLACFLGEASAVFAGPGGRLDRASVSWPILNLWAKIRTCLRLVDFTLGVHWN